MNTPFPYAVDNENPTRGDVVAILIGLNVVAFLLERSSADPFAFAFVPAHPTWYTWVTSAFLHAGWVHLLSNMYALYY